MRRRLGLSLRTLRQRSGLNLPDAVKLLGLSGPSALSKTENGKQRVPAVSLGKSFQVYEVRDERRIQEIRQLAAQASSSRRTNLFDQYRDAVRDPFADYLELEELALHAEWYAAQLIPGLLQTPEYAYAVVEGSGKWETAREERTFVELRLKRQQVLRRERPLSMWCVLDEAVVRRAMGSKHVLVGQLRHLLAISDELPGVEIQVLPFSVGVHAGIDGTFTPTWGDPLHISVVRMPSWCLSAAGSMAFGS